ATSQKSFMHRSLVEQMVHPFPCTLRSLRVCSSKGSFLLLSLSASRQDNYWQGPFSALGPLHIFVFFRIQKRAMTTSIFNIQRYEILPKLSILGKFAKFLPCYKSIEMLLSF